MRHHVTQISIGVISADLNDIDLLHVRKVISPLYSNVVIDHITETVVDEYRRHKCYICGPWRCHAVALQLYTPSYLLVCWTVFLEQSATALRAYVLFDDDDDDNDDANDDDE